MLHTGTLLRAEIYDDHIKPYTNVKAVYEAHKGKYPGKLIVTNGHWYNTKPVLPAAITKSMALCFQRKAGWTGVLDGTPGRLSR